MPPVGKIRARPAPTPAAKPAPEGTPLVAGTKQGWKVMAGLAGMTLAAIASVFQLVGPASLKEQAIGLAMGTGFLGIAALVSVRCPECDTSLAVWAFRTGTLTTWRERLAEVASCPSCGHSVAEKKP